MTFDSLTFCIFVLVGFLLYWIPSRKAYFQNVVLLLASLVFYGWFDIRFLGLMLLMTGFVYWMGLMTEKGSNGAFVSGVVGCLLVLGFFKYFNFFVESIVAVLRSAELQVSFPFWQIAAPIGLSFYSFQLIGYLCDVRRRAIKAERNPLDFALFACFFPQIVAGPIGRAGELLPQYRSIRRFDYGLAIEGCRQILWGAFAKFVIADNCTTIASTLLGCSTLDCAMVLVGAVVFTIQIYGDFSGYSNLAVGLAKLFGIRLRQNFAHPYFATSFGDFWRRWHISLTTWLRDYVYFSLGGSRCSTIKTIRNIWIVFLLSGFWHGAAWTFVVWGALHALFLTGERLRILPENKVLRWPIVMSFVMIAWLMFQAPSFGRFEEYIFALRNLGGVVWPRLPMNVIGTSLFGILCLFVFEGVNSHFEFGLSRLPASRCLRWSLYLILALMVLLCNGAGQSFIYQKF